ncbi:hypothetical protein SAMN04488094_104213 [Tropicimonas isoalkanivorans]|uniref:Uncharacterized protein n=1 Tax=Tropicimonas isoalkanivorans TaxID=441112 RepID=A0A1I1ITM8_9RHOB|nr:hypothetical protein SAMN04488094_104213 [Tropicimonas isoalkanivorans]
MYLRAFLTRGWSPFDDVSLPTNAITAVAHVEAERQWDRTGRPCGRTGQRGGPRPCVVPDAVAGIWPGWRTDAVAAAADM